MNVTDKILEKLRKLTNLKQSAEELGNIGEMNAAAAGISRLLLEYNLSEEDIPTEEREKNPIVMEKIHAKPEVITIGVGTWFERLLFLICKFNTCKLIKNDVGKKTVSYSIIGRKNNVEVTMYMESFLVNRFYQCAKMDYKKYKVEFESDELNRALFYKPIAQAAYIRSYMNGACVGLQEKMDQMRREVESEHVNVTSIVVQRKKEIDDYVSSQFKNLKTSFLKSDKIYSSGYNNGVETGRNTDINKGIEANHKEQKMI